MQATIGNMIQFEYDAVGYRDSYVGRLVTIRDTKKDPIQFATKWYSGYRCHRSQYLITVATPMGYRQFYTGSISNARPLGLFARFAFWIRGINFPKFAVR